MCPLPSLEVTSYLFLHWLEQETGILQPVKKVFANTRFQAKLYLGKGFHGELFKGKEVSVNAAVRADLLLTFMSKSLSQTERHI